MTSTYIECKICGARATKAQLMDGTHISPSLCSLNKEVNDLRENLSYLENLKDNLSAEIKELDCPGIGENIIPSRDLLKLALRSLKTDIKSSSSQVAQLQRVKEAFVMHRVTQGLPLSYFERKFTLCVVK